MPPDLDIQAYFCARLTLERELRQLSLKTLAKELGLTVSDLRQIEEGKVDITLRSADKLAQALGLDLVELLRIS